MRSAYERTVALDVQAIQEYTAGIEAARDEYADIEWMVATGEHVDRAAAPPDPTAAQIQALIDEYPSAESERQDWIKTEVKRLRGAES